MIGIIAQATVAPESREAFKESAQVLVEQTRSKDTGCISYDFGLLVEEGTEGDYAFFERWESQEALDAHQNSAHFKEAVEQWENYLQQPLEVHTYDL